MSGWACGGPENGYALPIRMLRKTIINKHSSNRRNLFYELLVPSSPDSDFDLFAHGQTADGGQQTADSRCRAKSFRGR